MATMFKLDAADGWEWSVLGDSPIVRKSDGAVVGYVSSSAYGIQTKSTIAMGYVLLEDDPKTGCVALQKDDELVTLSYGFEWPTTILASPPVEMLGRVD
jgi:glycine cleavage system aminomethyltransferase T